MPLPTFLDTDIGDDIDDLMALAIACFLEGTELEGVGTVFGPAERRTIVTRSVLELVSKKVPVYAGAGVPTTPEIANLEFAEHIRKRFSLDEGIRLYLEYGLEESELPPCRTESACQALAGFWDRHGSDSRAVAIGALTNLALALRRTEARPPLVVMAGRFTEPMWAEWNVKCDPWAASELFTSGCHVDVIPFDIGVEMSFTPEETAQFANDSTPLGALIKAIIDLWLGQGFNFHVWDLLAVLASIEPERFEWNVGTVSVDREGPSIGWTHFVSDPSGRHRIAVGGDRNAVVERMIGILERACEASKPFARRKLRLS